MTKINKIFEEDGFKFDFSKSLSAKKFDVEDKDEDKYGYKHGLLNRSMQAVDFIVEEDDKFLFIEVKDLSRIRSNIKLANELVRKFRDTLIYFCAQRKISRKPIHYICLLAQADGDKLLRMSDLLNTHLPFDVDKEIWKRNILAEYYVVNLARWGEEFGNYKVTRLP